MGRATSDGNITGIAPARLCIPAADTGDLNSRSIAAIALAQPQKGARLGSAYVSKHNKPAKSLTNSVYCLRRYGKKFRARGMIGVHQKVLSGVMAAGC
jgi:hypothetical protein